MKILNLVYVFYDSKTVHQEHSFNKKEYVQTTIFCIYLFYKHFCFFRDRFEKYVTDDVQRGHIIHHVTIKWIQ